jgi:hypothetical protein
MNAIRLFYSRFNYNSTTKGRGKCEKSLMHTLRILLEALQELDWKEELVDENLIWINDEIHKLSDFSEDEKYELLYKVAPKPKMRDKKKHQNNRRKYKLKLKKAIASEAENGNKEASDFMKEILQFDDSKFISYSRLEKFEKLEMSRKNQRLQMLRIYIESHNLLSNSVDNENSVYVQEGIFRIPHRWGVGTDVVTKEDYINIVRDFLTENFTNYPIETIVCHDDERLLEENTGAHSHYFLSGKNEKTGDYDLHKAQIKAVNRYIKQFGDIDDRLPDNGKLNRKQSGVFGEYFQRMFYDYTNKHLLISKGLVAEFSPETERQSQERKMINRESKLPKRLRSHNMYSREAEILSSRLDDLKERICAENDELKLLDNNLEQQKEALEFNDTQIEEAKLVLEHYINQAQLSFEESMQQEERLNKLTEQVEVLDTKTGNAIADICRKIYSVSALRDRGLDAKAQKFIEQILIEFSSLEPSLLNNVCGAAARAINEEALISGLKVSEIFDEPVIK